MKITRKQLAQIIAEEKQKIASQKSFGSNAARQETLREGMKEMEMELVEEIVMLLVENGAVNSGQGGYDTGNYDDDVYQDALDYVRDAVIPHLKDLASRGAWDRKPGR